MLYFGYGAQGPHRSVSARLSDSGPRLSLATRSDFTSGAARANAMRFVPTIGTIDCLDRLSDEQVAKLDKCEGPDYSRITVQVIFGKQTVDAALYVAKPDAVTSELHPFDWYKDLVLIGA